MRNFKLPDPPAWLIILALFFGSMLALTLPPGQVPDEYQHFGRSYALSEGYLFPITAQLPQGISQILHFNAQLPFHPENKHRPADLIALGHLALQADQRVPQAIPAASVYSPVPYLFSALGIILARTLGLAPLWIFYAGRLANLAAWISFCYLGLRSTPVFRWFFLLLMLAPMSLNQAASYSADSLTNAICFLWLCLCLKYALDGKPITWRRTFILIGFAALLPLTKPPYTALLLSVAIIPAIRFSNKKIYLAIILSMFVLSMTLFFASVRINRDYYYAQLKFPGVDAPAQQANLLRQPQIFFKAALVTMVEDARFIWESYVGVLGWLDTRLPTWIYWSFPLALLFTALVDFQPYISLAAWQKAWFFCAGLTAFLLVAAGQWITWTPLSSRKISDIQGRYLIPIVPTLLLSLYNHRFDLGRKALPGVIPVYLILTLVAAISMVIQRYYMLS